MKYMTKMRQGRERGRERGGEGGGGGKEGGVHRVLDYTYPELSVARARLVPFQFVVCPFLFCRVGILGFYCILSCLYFVLF